MTHSGGKQCNGRKDACSRQVGNLLLCGFCKTLVAIPVVVKPCHQCDKRHCLRSFTSEEIYFSVQLSPKHTDTIHVSTKKTCKDAQNVVF